MAYSLSKTRNFSQSGKIVGDESWDNNEAGRSWEEGVTATFERCC